MVIPHDKKKNAILIEFKTVASTELKKLSDAAQKALDQIIPQGICQELYQRKFKKIIAFGIAFAGKKLAIVSQKITK